MSNKIIIVCMPIIRSYVSFKSGDKFYHGSLTQRLFPFEEPIQLSK